MIKKRNAAFLATLIAIPMSATVYANPLEMGHLKISELPAMTASASVFADVAEVSKPEEKKKNMGNINIANDIILSIRREDPAEVVRVKTQLASAIEYANRQQYDKAISILETLKEEHTESRAIVKWLGIYQNWDGQYTQSVETLEDYISSYPLEDHREFIVAYYMIDNSRHLGIDIKPLLAPLSDMAEKESATRGVNSIFSMKDLSKTLVNYQKFLVETDYGKTLKPTDSKALDDLWHSIPKEKYQHLDNYYGYNIDELTPIYANFYHRKDLETAYAERTKQRADYLAAREAETAVTIKKTNQPTTTETPVPEQAPETTD